VYNISLDKYLMKAQLIGKHCIV